MHHQSKWGLRPEREPDDEVHLLGKKIKSFWPFLDGLEQGMLRLIQPLSLAEGTRVEVIVIMPEPTAEGRTPADILATIAALPMNTEDEEFSGRNHDKILYGDKGAR